jgi:hypothetical protein
MNPRLERDDPVDGGPVFIGGASRSGKTLLRWILASHPAFAVSRRTEMWPRYWGRFGDLSRPEQARRCLDAMFARPQIQAMGVGRDRIDAELRRGAPTYARLFALMHEDYARRAGKPRWGDQSEGLERFADNVLAAYPGARLIHMIRDPRDRFAAVRERDGGLPLLLARSTASWLTSAALAEKNLRLHGDAYRVLRYETLVRRPSESVRALCDFLGVPFDEHAVRMDDARRYDAERLSSPDRIPISDADVGRFRAELPATDVAFIQTTAGAGMRRLGYDLEPSSLHGTERIGFTVLDLPLGLAGVGSARALDAVRGRRWRRGRRCEEAA